MEACGFFDLALDGRHILLNRRLVRQLGKETSEIHISSLGNGISLVSGWGFNRVWMGSVTVDS